jgi:hypothetical protein
MMKKPGFLGETRNKKPRRPRNRATLSAVMNIGHGGARQTEEEKGMNLDESAL